MVSCHFSLLREKREQEKKRETLLFSNKQPCGGPVWCSGLSVKLESGMPTSKYLVSHEVHGGDLKPSSPLKAAMVTKWDRREVCLFIFFFLLQNTVNSQGRAEYAILISLEEGWDKTK